jgi:hypothetical protein
VIVKAQAIVVRDGRLVVARERRRGFEQLALPGARVQDRESVTHALARGALRSMRIEIEPIRLLYIAEIPGLYAAPDLHLVWLAEPSDSAASIPDAMLVDIGDGNVPALDPPIMTEIAADAEDGWPETPRWLGYVEPGSGVSGRSGHRSAPYGQPSR